MGYRELLGALQEEVGRQVRELRDGAAEQSRRLLAAAEQAVAAEREAALDAEGRRLQEESSRSLSDARLERERVLLEEMSRAMAGILVEAEARLPARDGPALLARLLDELAPELGEGPVELAVKPGDEDALRRHVERRHPGLTARVTIRGASDVGGGVRASLGGRQILDNTLPSRLRNAWQRLEPDVARILFGDERGEP